MFAHRVLLITLATITAASCADPSAPAPSETARLSLGQDRQLVTGSGHVQTVAGLREFTFHAVEQPDAGVTGSYKVVLPNGLFFEADVTCMSVAGNTGWIAGTIRATNAGIVVLGSRSMFWVRDNGEGEGAVDIVSVAAFNFPEGTDLAFCANRPLELAPQSVTGGNVQVR